MAAHDIRDTGTYTAPDLLRLRAGQDPERSALCIDGAGTLTFGDWERRSNAAARVLRRRGVRREVRVALIFGEQEWIEYAVAYFGVLKAGGTAVHLGAGLDPPELLRRLDQCAVTAIVHGDTVVPPPNGARWTAAASTLERGDDAPVRLSVVPEDIADVLYTSGTTGPAKAFTNPHGTLTFGRGPAGLARLDVSAPLLAPMPMGTPSSAMTVGMMPLNSPSTVVVCRPDSAELIAELIARHRVTTLLATPWIAIRMVNAQVHRRHDLSSLTTIAVASAPLPAATAVGLSTMVPGVTITTAFAQGEAVPAVMLNVFDPARPASVGRSGAGTEMRVVDEDGNPVPAGEIGEIWLRSAAPKRRYLDPELNAQVHVDGWTRTRDLGYLGPDGDLYLFDRAVDAIRTDGALVSSVAVEGALYEHPAVLEAAVVGVPAGGRGQAVVAAVVLDAPSALPGLRAFLAGRLPQHEVPQAVHPLPALPRGITGKVLKNVLRARFAGSSPAGR